MTSTNDYVNVTSDVLYRYFPEAGMLDYLDMVHFCVMNWGVIPYYYVHSSPPERHRYKGKLSMGTIPERSGKFLNLFFPQAYIT